ncbi:MT-A70 family methyltransferase [Rhizobium sp. YTUHZ044]|uniref:MT-A70 family methyltransferase n=1 Tax=Rhizobium sp. YTUHZ044 TaxID=2962678 RepID=UPI003DA8AF7C
MNDLPAGKFGCILADPPWRFATFSAKGRGRSPDGILTPEQMRNLSRTNNPERHYATMALDDIKAMPVGDMAAKDCVLLMWAVDPMLPEALEVGQAWGFKFKTVGFVWAKERRVTSKRGADMAHDHHKQFPMGTGYWTRANPELCLLFTKGKPKRLSAAVRKLLIAPRREHSRKPDQQYDDIERLVAGPYLELFARTERPGWVSWGNQTDRFNAAA